MDRRKAILGLLAISALKINAQDWHTENPADSLDLQIDENVKYFSVKHGARVVKVPIEDVLDAIEGQPQDVTICKTGGKCEDAQIMTRK